MQFNGIYQNLPSFHNPYYGQNSLMTSEGKGHAFSQIYGVYLNSQIVQNLQTYLDIEMAQGDGISGGVGLGGYTKGDVIRQGSANLGKGPYVAHFYARYIYPLSAETEKEGDGPTSRG